ncbi:unnamed protein product, partial [Mesorhabditis spiculigera]
MADVAPKKRGRGRPPKNAAAAGDGAKIAKKTDAADDAKIDKKADAVDDAKIDKKVDAVDDAKNDAGDNADAGDDVKTAKKRGRPPQKKDASNAKTAPPKKRQRSPDSSEEPEDESSDKSSASPKKTAGRPAKKQEVKKDTAADAAPKKRGRPKKADSASTSKSTKQAAKDEDEEVNDKKPTSSGHKSIPRTLRVVGPAPVFECCTQVDLRVYETNGSIYSAMLNKTDIGNNNNKFYGIQTLYRGGSYSCLIWWGRVGYAGQHSLTAFADAAGAVGMFCSKFLAKTGLSWDERKEEPMPGKYRMIELETFGEATHGMEAEDKENDEDIPDSTLLLEVQQLIKLITNLSMLRDGIRSIELSYENSEKMPLGKLTMAQLERGYTSLRAIEEALKKPKVDRNQLRHATNEFYSNIPHSLGMKAPHVIDSLDEVRDKCELLDTLKEVQIAIKTINAGDTGEGEKLNPIDRMYNSLHCDLEVVDRASADFGFIKDYMNVTHARTHAFSMEPVQMFRVNRHEERERFVDHGNRMLLWHGSRPTNFCGILSQGLRIAPPEAPSTGYMFGKGIYFADSSSKSANYCFPRDKEHGLLILAEVSLGNMNEKKDADYDAAKLPKNKHSTFGMGQWTPMSTEAKFPEIEEGLVVPNGFLQKNPARNDCSLLYNEYIVYNEDQVRIRYLVQTRFDLAF